MSTSIATPQTNTNDWEAMLPTIRHMYADGATDAEFRIFCETARALGLNPILKQIWCVKNKKRPELPAQIYASRDGLVTIAHRSGQFDGMESGVKTDENGEMIGWCRVWRKDMSHPFYEEAPRSEYDTKNNLWLTHPTTMLKKVVETHAFKRAFDICGVYTPEEMGEQGERAMIQNVAPPRTLQAAETPAEALPEGAAQFAGCINDMEHCYECGEKIDPTREGRVSKQNYGRYLCMEHLKQAKAEEAGTVTQVKPAAPKAAPPAAPKAVAEPAPDAQRDQPSTSPLASTIAGINARQEALDKAEPANVPVTKKPMPEIKPDPHAGIVSACQICKKGVTEAERSMSRQSLEKTLCKSCLDKEFASKPAVKA